MYTSNSLTNGSYVYGYSLTDGSFCEHQDNVNYRFPTEAEHNAIKDPSLSLQVSMHQLGVLLSQIRDVICIFDEMKGAPLPLGDNVYYILLLLPVGAKRNCSGWSHKII